MSAALISLDPHLKRLADEGFEIEVANTHLVVRSVPYVATDGTLARGVLTCALSIDAAWRLSNAVQRMENLPTLLARADYVSLHVPAMDATQLRVYGQLCGWTLARAHSRSGDRVALAGYLGDDPELDVAMAQFAEAYADQNAADFAAMQQAATAGRIKVADKGW